MKSRAFFGEEVADWVKVSVGLLRVVPRRYFGPVQQEHGQFLEQNCRIRMSEETQTNCICFCLNVKMTKGDINRHSPVLLNLIIS